MVASRQSLSGELVLVVVCRCELSNMTSWCRVKRRDSREVDLTAKIPTPDVPPRINDLVVPRHYSSSTPELVTPSKTSSCIAGHRECGSATTS
jgi:hypothetical protein